MCASVALLVGCAGHQAVRTRRGAELGIGGSLVGVIAGSIGIAAFPEDKPTMIGITATFGALAVACAIVYGVAHANVPPPEPPPPPPPDRRPEAWAKTQEAQTAARTGDCDRVRALSVDVRGLDDSFYSTVFVRDAAIARCLAAQ
jgi:hypothetical protein